LKQGDEVVSGEKTPYTPGCCMELRHMPLGAVIHNIELTPGRGGQLVRSAGRSAQLMARSEGCRPAKCAQSMSVAARPLGKSPIRAVTCVLKVRRDVYAGEASVRKPVVPR
jgi:hypothetical protein